MNAETVVDSAFWRSVVADAGRRYVAQRREQVGPFCARHFSVQGAFRIHRKALGHDLWRAPANVIWAVPYLISRGALHALRRFGWERVAAGLERVPPGFTTAVAREIEWLIYTELLELPIVQPDRSSSRDALLETLAGHEAVAGLLVPELQALDAAGHQGEARQKLETFFRTYTASRTAAADLAGSVLNLAAGAATLHQFTPGAVSLGSAAAAALAQQIAIQNFALGPTLGSLYYGLFPAAASAGLIAATVGGLMVAMGVLSAFTGILTDPVQQVLGLHERRLHKLLDALEASLTGTGEDFRLRDAYVARIFDLVDVIRGAVAAVR